MSRDKLLYEPFLTDFLMPSENYQRLIYNNNIFCGYKMDYNADDFLSKENCFVYYVVTLVKRLPNIEENRIFWVQVCMFEPPYCEKGLKKD